ncbi:hypothetical protein HU200_008000 [Digitaria exilis]|uniref:Histone deacetylase complex subunit SAP30 Sin3 binding domain-containing protein n=1 Tax=Digitaria exilis TaxID=1010633 RepID=A0A835KU15_9POAL|nr:hypothetical protein HU200_008000 [Digitaria exilis]
MMMGTQLCSSRVLSLPRDENGDEELSVLPQHTKVIVTGNNRTKSVLVGLQGVVKKAVGLGGWHWLVLKNGVEVKLQRNALSVLEAPTGNEDDDIDGNNSFCSSSDMGEKDMDYCKITPQELHFGKLLQATNISMSLTFFCSFCANSKHRVPQANKAKSSAYKAMVLLRKAKQPRQCPVDFKAASVLWLSCCTMHACFVLKVNLRKLGTPTLWRYWKHFNLVSMNPNPSKEELFHGVQQHFQSQFPCDNEKRLSNLCRCPPPNAKNYQQLDEMQVILDFIQTAKRLKILYNSS